MPGIGCTRHTELTTSNGGWLVNPDDERNRFTIWVPVPCPYCNGYISITSYEDDSQGCVLTGSDDYYGNLISNDVTQTIHQLWRYGEPGHIDHAWKGVLRSVP